MPYKLDVEAMRRAAAELTGTHDFKAFCASGSEVKSTVRTLRRIEIGQAGSEICFDFYGNGFLYNMVRILVGTLVYVGQGRIRAGQVGEILRSTDRRLAALPRRHTDCIWSAYSMPDGIFPCCTPAHGPAAETDAVCFRFPK